MLEINPQLQSKIFASLLFHMKAERADSGTAVKTRTGLSSEKISAPTWANLALDLSKIGLKKTTADALIFWANSQTEQCRRTQAKIRILHPMEREFISVDAYDYLLELYRLGLIGPAQLEMLIENCGYLTSLPATREQIQKMVLRTFSESIDAQGLGVSH